MRTFRMVFLIIGLFCLSPMFTVAEGTKDIFLNDSVTAKNTSTLVIDSISVDLFTQKIQISWTLTTSETVGFIEIHRQREDGNFNAIHQTSSLAQDFFTDLTSDPSQHNYYYFIVARHPDGNAFATSLAHRAAFQNAPVGDPCARTVEISWEPYSVTTSSGAPQPVQGPFTQQQLWVSFNSQNYQMISSMSAEANEYTLPVTQSFYYCFLIRSVDNQNNVTSTSNRSCVYVQVPEVPEFNYLASASIPDGNTVVIKDHSDNTASSPNYVIRRGVSPTQIDQEVASFGTDDSPIMYEDVEVPVNSHSWFYQVEVLDSCKKSILFSNIVETVFLEGEAIDEATTRLRWAIPEGWAEGIARFEVYRKLPSEAGFVLMSELSPIETDFDDSWVGFDPDEFYKAVYQLAAVQNDGNPYGYQEKSFSNHVILERTIQLNMPNAFRPDSDIEVNRLFKPKFSYKEVQSYEMRIYNRWGQLVFETNNVEEGWDGTFNGSKAPAGAYNYVVRYEDQNGMLVEKAGMVVLVR